jgi:hypothetical protein
MFQRFFFDIPIAKILQFMFLQKNFKKIHFKGLKHAKIPKWVILSAQVILSAPTVL